MRIFEKALWQEKRSKCLFFKILSLNYLDLMFCAEWNQHIWSKSFVLKILPKSIENL
jgi:hypothetical protein